MVQKYNCDYALSHQLDAITQEPDSSVRRRATYLWIEMGVVLLTCVAPLIFESMTGVDAPRAERSTMAFVPVAKRYLVEYVGQIALVLFIIWRSNDSPNRFGLQPFRIGRDIVGGIAIFAALRGANYLLWWGIRTFLSHKDYLALIHSGAGSSYDSPSGTPEYILLGFMCLFSGFTQELVMRAYLIVRFEELLDSTSIAVLLSTVLFTCYHGYQGAAGIIATALFGLMQAIIFCLFRRLVPIAFAHAVGNFISIGKLARW